MRPATRFRLLLKTVLPPGRTSDRVLPFRQFTNAAEYSPRPEKFLCCQGGSICRSSGVGMFTLFQNRYGGCSSSRHHTRLGLVVLTESPDGGGAKWKWW